MASLDSGKSGGNSAGLRALWVLALVNLVDQVDTSILRGVLPLLEEEWSLSDFQLGLLGFAFIFVHTLAAVPSGWVADNYRRTRIIGYTLLSWSALSAFAAASVNYLHLFFARAMLGVGQAVDDPSSTSLLADYYPARMRGKVFSVQQVMTFIGGGLGLGLGGFVGSTLGWRWAFLLVGAPGSVVAFLVFKLRNPGRGESDLGATPVEMGGMVQETRRHSEESLSQFVLHAARELFSEIRMIFRIRTMRYILVGVGTLLFTVSGVGYWLAVYHQRYSGLSVGQATAVTAGVLAFGGIIGTLAGGFLADRAYLKGVSGRITMAGGGILACTVLFLISYNVPVLPRLFLQLVGVACITSSIPGIRASMMDVIPVQSRGVGSSAFALVSALFGTALAPPVVGIISDITSSLLAAFYIVSPPIIAGSLILLRARHTVQEDAQAIIQALMARANP